MGAANTFLLLINLVLNLSGIPVVNQVVYVNVLVLASIIVDLVLQTPLTAVWQHSVA